MITKNSTSRVYFRTVTLIFVSCLLLQSVSAKPDVEESVSKSAAKETLIPTSVTTETQALHTKVTKQTETPEPSSFDFWDVLSSALNHNDESSTITHKTEVASKIQSAYATSKISKPTEEVEDVVENKVSTPVITTSSKSPIRESPKQPTPTSETPKTSSHATVKPTITKTEDEAMGSESSGIISSREVSVTKPSESKPTTFAVESTERPTPTGSPKETEIVSHSETTEKPTPTDLTKESEIMASSISEGISHSSSTSISIVKTTEMAVPTNTSTHGESDLPSTTKSVPTPVDTNAPKSSSSAEETPLSITKINSSTSTTDSSVTGTVESPAISTTDSSVISIAKSPVISATNSPLATPTNSPSSSATDSPVSSATDSATDSAIVSATKSPVISATNSPVASPSNSVEGPSDSVDCDEGGDSCMAPAASFSTLPASATATASTFTVKSTETATEAITPVSYISSYTAPETHETATESDVTPSTTISWTPTTTSSNDIYETSATNEEVNTVETTSTPTSTDEPLPSTSAEESTTSFTPSSTYRYQTYSWLTNTFSISIQTSTPSSSASQTSTSVSSDVSVPTPTEDPTLPQYIAPNINAIIPETSEIVSMRFNYLSYSQMVSDAILTAQFVQALPMMISSSLGCSVDDVIVVTITSASDQSGRSATLHQRRLLVRDEQFSGVIVAVAIPETDVPTLQNLVEDPSSQLYSPANGQLAMLIDSSYFVAKNGGNSDEGATSNGLVSDPNEESNNPVGATGENSGLSTNGIIGIAVSCGVVVYAVATVLVVRKYRRRRAQRDAENATQQQVFAQSISSPIMQENSLGWTAQQTYRHQPYPGQW